ncbi:MAG: putative hydrolase YxeP [Acidimicrobiales bacterium AG-410-I20]|nr:MAG: putative hydrolase YxeP [Acidimicrobiales bacterium AG-410-I20]
MDCMNELLDAASSVFDDVVAFRRDIHQHPELGLDNPRTQEKILDALSGLPLDISTGEELTSVVADLDGANDGPTILLRADTDALPMTEDSGESFCSLDSGKAHACGHDAHTAMLVGAARLLSQRREDISGRVRFMFQPGEEGAGGAPIMIEEGVLKDVDRAFAIHITPNIPTGYAACRPGPFMASTDTLRVTVTGKGGHASTPYLCTDPIPAMATMITSLQTAVTREINAFDPALISVTHVKGGTTTNVIPETVFFEGTIRCVSERTRDKVRDAIRRVCTQIALAHDCEASVSLEEGYPVTVNHADQSDFFGKVCKQTLGEGKFLTMPSPVMGGEDFSYVLQQVPGVMAFLGVCPDDVKDSLQAAPCHSNRMRLNEAAMINGMALHVGMVLND